MGGSGKGYRGIVPLVALVVGKEKQVRFFRLVLVVSVSAYVTLMLLGIAYGVIRTILEN